MRVIGVGAEDIPAIIPQLTPFLMRMEAEGRTPASHILRELQDRELQCWLIVDGQTIHAVALTRIYEINRKICEIAHLAGTGMEAWEDAIEVISAWAKSLGCAEIEANARPGFRKLARERGFSEISIRLRRTLNG